MMEARACTQDGCQVAVSGKCLEGFEPLANCPYYKTAHAVPVDERQDSSPADTIELPSGEALDIDEASQLSRDEPTKLVVLAGPPDSGKTTIVTSLYEAFQQAPFGNLLFAGSKTLVGFERRCHPGREDSTQSQGAVAGIARTPLQEGIKFLHLRLGMQDRGRVFRHSLLLSDIAGEVFQQIKDSAKAVQEIPILKEASHFCVVIDGEKLARKEQRQLAKNDARVLLRSVIEAHALSPNCQIDVVFSKWDLVLTAPEVESSAEFVLETQAALRNTVGGRGINFFEVAARPETEKLPFAHGMPTMLRSWLQNQGSGTSRTTYLSSGTKSDREFSRFSKRAFTHSNLKDSIHVEWV